MTDTPELLPCPFCGSPANIRFCEKGYYPVCSSCGGGYGKNFKSADEAIAAWNTRAEKTCKIMTIDDEDEFGNKSSTDYCTACDGVIWEANESTYCPECGARIVRDEE